jgi:tetratricopeptide (TPR) repeat protein
VQAGEQWRRAFELWPAEAEYAGTPGVRRAEAYLAAILAVEWTDWSAAAAVAEGALAAIGEPRDATEALAFSRIGTIRGDQGDPAAGLALVDQALAVLDPATHPAECAHALLGRQYLLRGLDRIEESDAAAARAVELTADTAPALHRRALAVNAGHDAGRSGRLEEALEGVQTAVRLVPEKPDPAGDLIVAGYHVLALMCAGRGADEVVAAGRPGLESAAAWGLDKIQVLGLLDNMALALMWEGRVREAAELIDPATEEPFTPMSWPLYVRRGVLDLLRGRADDATTLLDAVSEMFVMDVANRVERALAAPAADLWCGRPQRAYDRLTSALNESLSIEDPAADIGGLLVLAARAAADMAAESRGDALLRATLAHELEDLMARAARDPFDGSGFHSDRPAQRVTWDAELARLSGSPSLERWAKAAAAWDELGRVHDSAYCRWRGAQAALGGGQGTTAARLLRRAERDAQEHVPLLDSIRATVTPMARV